jgi:membrane-associated phospholipid phosphatase
MVNNRLARVRAFNLYAGLTLAALGCFAALGWYVVSHGEPALFVAWERALFDRSTLVAWWLTWACYPKVLVPVCVLLLFFAWRIPEWRSRVILSIVSVLVCWAAADYFQRFFSRPRPAHWVVKHELSFSYPSSHATIATGFYVLWAGLLYTSELPEKPRKVAAGLLLILAVAICWSRLALGAHYLTDLIGGALLGFAVVCLALWIYGNGLFGRPAGRAAGPAE